MCIIRASFGFAKLISLYSFRENFMKNSQEGIFFDSPDKYLGEVFETPEESGSKQKRDFGRWTIQQSQIYLQVLRQSCLKDILKELKKALPGRGEAQIRAHHQKMIRKYGSVEQILDCLDLKENSKLIQLNSRLQACLSKLDQIVVNIPLSVSRSSTSIKTEQK